MANLLVDWLNKNQNRVNLKKSNTNLSGNINSSVTPNPQTNTMGTTTTPNSPVNKLNRINQQTQPTNQSRFIGFQDNSVSSMLNKNSNVDNSVSRTLNNNNNVAKTDLAGNIISANNTTTDKKGLSYKKESGKQTITVPTAFSKKKAEYDKANEEYKANEDMIKQLHYDLQENGGVMTIDQISQKYPQFSGKEDIVQMLQSDILPYVKKDEFANMREIAQVYPELLPENQANKINLRSENQKILNENKEFRDLVKRSKDVLSKTNNILSDSGKEYAESAVQLSEMVSYLKDNFRIKGNPTDSDILNYAYENIPDAKKLIDGLKEGIMLTDLDKAQLFGKSDSTNANIASSLWNGISAASQWYQENIQQPVNDSISNGTLSKQLQQVGLNSSSSNTISKLAGIPVNMAGGALQGTEKTVRTADRLFGRQDEGGQMVTDAIQMGGGLMTTAFNTAFAIPTAIFEAANLTEAGEELTDLVLGNVQTALTDLLDGTSAENLGLSKDNAISRWYNSLDEETQSDLVNEATLYTMHKLTKGTKEWKLRAEVAADAFVDALEKGKNGAKFQAWVEKGLAGEGNKATEGAVNRVMKEGYSDFRKALRDNFSRYNEVLNARKGKMPTQTTQPTDNTNLTDQRTPRQKGRSVVKDVISKGKEKATNVAETVKNTDTTGLVKGTSEKAGEIYKGAEDTLSKGKEKVNEINNSIKEGFTTAIDKVKGTVKDNIVTPFNKGRGITNLNTEQGLKLQEQQQGQSTGLGEGKINGNDNTKNVVNSNTLNKAQEQLLQNYNRMNPKAISDFNNRYGESYGQFLADRGFTKAGEDNLQDLSNYAQELNNIKSDALDKMEGEYKDQSINDMLKEVVKYAKDTLDRDALARFNELAEKNAKSGLKMAEINEVRKRFQYHVRTGFFKEGNSKGIARANNIYMGVKKFLDKTADEYGLDLNEINQEISKVQHIMGGLAYKLDGSSANNMLGINDYIMLGSLLIEPSALPATIAKIALKNGTVRNKILELAIGRRGNSANRISRESLKNELEQIMAMSDKKRQQKAMEDFYNKYIASDNTPKLPNKGGTDGGKNILTNGKTIITDKNGNSKVKGQISEIDKRKPSETKTENNVEEKKNLVAEKSKVTQKKTEAKDISVTNDIKRGIEVLKEVKDKIAEKDTDGIMDILNGVGDVDKFVNDMQAFASKLGDLKEYKRLQGELSMSEDMAVGDLNSTIAYIKSLYDRSKKGDNSSQFPSKTVRNVIADGLDEATKGIDDAMVKQAIKSIRNDEGVRGYVYDQMATALGPTNNALEIGKKILSSIGIDSKGWEEVAKNIPSYYKEKTKNKVTAKKQTNAQKQESKPNSNKTEHSPDERKQLSTKEQEKNRQAALKVPNGTLLYTSGEFKYIPSVKQGLIRLSREEGEKKLKEQMKSALDNGFSMDIWVDEDGNTFVYNGSRGDEIKQWEDKPRDEMVDKVSIKGDNIDKYYLDGTDLTIILKDSKDLGDYSLATEVRGSDGEYTYSPIIIDLDEFLTYSNLSKYVPTGDAKSKGISTGKNKITAKQESALSEDAYFDDIDPKTLKTMKDMGDEMAIKLYEEMGIRDEMLVEMYSDIAKEEKYESDTADNVTPQRADVEETQKPKTVELKKRDDLGQVFPESYETWGGKNSYFGKLGDGYAIAHPAQGFNKAILELNPEKYEMFEGVAMYSGDVAKNTTTLRFKTIEELNDFLKDAQANGLKQAIEKINKPKNSVTKKEPSKAKNTVTNAQDTVKKFLEKTNNYKNYDFLNESYRWTDSMTGNEYKGTYAQFLQFIADADGSEMKTRYDGGETAVYPYGKSDYGHSNYDFFKVPEGSGDFVKFLKDNPKIRGLMPKPMGIMDYVAERKESGNDYAKESTKEFVEGKYELLPENVSVNDEARKSKETPKRIAPSRIAWQQETYEEGVAKVAEQVQAVANYLNIGVKLRMGTSKMPYNEAQALREEYKMASNKAGEILFRKRGFKSDKSKEFKELWKNITEAREDKKALGNIAKDLYIKKVKDDVANGYMYPQEVIDSVPGIRTAKDKYLAYLKGWNTSFSQKDARKDSSLRDTIGADLKRQDGKTVTAEFKQYIKDGMTKYAKALNLDLKRLNEDLGLMYADLNLKRPFLIKGASGVYHPSTRVVSVNGGHEAYKLQKPDKTYETVKVETTFAHELTHAIDHILNWNLISKPILVELKSKMNKEGLENSSRGMEYWGSDVEMTARMVQQYVAVSEGIGEQYYSRPGQWNKDVFEQIIKPEVERAFSDKLGDYYKDPTEIKYQKFGVGKGEDIDAKAGLLVKNFLNNKSVEQMANERGLDVEVVKSLTSADGIRLYGQYGNGLITLADKIKNNTASHELFHGLFDMVDKQEKEGILTDVQSEKGMNREDSEEWLADNFAEYWKTGNLLKDPELPMNYREFCEILDDDIIEEVKNERGFKTNEEVYDYLEKEGFNSNTGISEGLKKRISDFFDKCKARAQYLIKFREKVKSLFKDMIEGRKGVKHLDNNGNGLSVGMSKYMEKSKARVGEKTTGALVEVYHTTTNNMIPFTEFNPVGTQGYRFGDDIVNYYTDDKDMSGSYANQQYKEYKGTAGLYTREDVNKIIEGINLLKLKNKVNKETMDLYIKEVDKNDGYGYDAKYALFNRWDMKKIENLKKVVSKMPEDEIDIFYKGGKRGSVRDYIENDTDIEYWDNGRVSEKAKELEELRAKAWEHLEELTKKEGVDIYDMYYLQKYEKHPEGQYAGFRYTSEKDLIRRIENDIDYIFGGSSNVQYDGYVNLENPYIIDAEGRSWKNVRSTEAEFINRAVSDWDKIPESRRTEIYEIMLEAYKKKMQNIQVGADFDWEEYGEMNEDFNLAVYESFPQEILNEAADDPFGAYSTINKMVKAIIQSKGGELPKGSLIDIAADYGLVDSDATNDIVKEVLRSNKAGITNYDGVIIKNVVDYGGKSLKGEAPHNLYVTFKSNQFKSKYNVFPTKDADIRYQKAKNLVTSTNKNKVTSSKSTSNNKVYNLATETQNKIGNAISLMKRSATAGGLVMSRFTKNGPIENALNTIYKANSNKKSIRGKQNYDNFLQGKEDGLLEIAKAIDLGYKDENITYKWFYDPLDEDHPTIIFWRGKDVLSSSDRWAMHLGKNDKTKASMKKFRDRRGRLERTPLRKRK